MSDSGQRSPGGRIKVLHVITRLIVGGAQENTIASVEKVDPERFDSHLWIGPQEGSEGSLQADARSRGIRLKVLDCLIREVRPWTDLRAIRTIARLLRANRFDIIHTHSSKAGIVARIAARIAGVPVVVHTAHGWGFHDRTHPLMRQIYIILEKWMLRWTDALIAVSNETIRTGLAAGIGQRSDYKLIRSGIPMDRFRGESGLRAKARRELGFAGDQIVIGSVGRLSPQKNPLDFVQLAERLCAGNDDRLRFLYVGDGPLRPEVENRIAAAGLTDKIVLAGVRHDVPEMFRAMDVFVLTSLWEGLPRVVPQALATGIPVVTYDIAGTSEAIDSGRTGYVVPAGDIESMANRVMEFITDDERREEAGTEARSQMVHEFSEEKMILDLEELYDELVRRDPSEATPLNC